MLEPEEIASRLPQWLRVALVGLLVVLATGGGLLAYRYLTLPKTLTVAAGSIDAEAVRIMSAIASRLTAINSPIRLKVVDAGTVLEASNQFSAGKVDLAVVRADIGELSAARTIVLLAYSVVLIVVPSAAGAESMDDLKGKTVGVVGGDVNHRLVEVLTHEYDLTRAKVRFKELVFADARKALQSKQVNALLVAMPISERYLALIREFLGGNAKQKPGLIPIEAAGAIARVAQAYESYDLPKGTLRGSPPIPADDMTTLRVPIYLVANKRLDDGDMADLAKVMMESRRDLVGEFPILAQITAPNTDKDAYIPVHPGAAAYFDGDQKDFFDRYSNALYYGPMLLGAVASLLAAAWKFVGTGANGKRGNPLEPMRALARRVRTARSENELAAIEEEIDTIFEAELTRWARSQYQSAGTAALSMAAQRLERLIDYRRSRIEAAPSIDRLDGTAAGSNQDADRGQPASADAKTQPQSYCP